MNVYEKLQVIQSKLEAKKAQWNDYSNYYYRSCEDILEALKPLLKENKLAITITDNVDHMGDRFYVRATVKLINIEKIDETIEVSASAREVENKKGMDQSQVTGSASSYARKYALNGMFAIDDAKDADSQNNKSSEKANQGKGTSSSSNENYNCSSCNTDIKQGVHAFSTSKFGKALCMNCQKKVK